MRHHADAKHVGLDLNGGSKESPRDREAVLRSMDRCTKCGICQAYCPVAAVAEAFPGPKYSGPQAQRFRVIEPIQESAPALCSGCGICTSVCPNDVAIADIITIARTEMIAGDSNLSLGQRILNRPDLVGRIGAIAPTIANAVLGHGLFRSFAEKLIGVHREAALPRLEGPTFRRWFERRRQPDGPSIAYFSGCAIEHYDPNPGIAAVRVLNRLGYRVTVPSRACCSLPMLSSGEWGAARRRAEALVDDLAAVANAGHAIVSTSTSCSLTLREKYAAYLSLTGDRAGRVAAAVVDICEFLARDESAEALEAALRPLHSHILYHGPCQLRGHRIGQPALELLRMIPGLEITPSEAHCCGVAGTYGYDRDKHDIAMAVGRTLFDQIAETKPDVVICDSETCRWHIERATGCPTRHPIELLAASIFEADPRSARRSRRKSPISRSQ